MLWLQQDAYGAATSSRRVSEHQTNNGLLVNPARVQLEDQLTDINLGNFLDNPDLNLRPISMKLSDLPKEFDLDKDRGRLENIFKLRESLGPEQAYLQASKLSNLLKNASLGEWIEFYKTDLLLEAELAKKSEKLSLSLQEYDDLLRRYPLNPQVPRVFYQMALVQLHMALYGDMNETLSRAIREHPDHDLAPTYHLMLAEAAFLSKDYLKAAAEFSFVIEKYPRHQASISSSFRRALMLFRSGDYSGALKMYDSLDKFHSDIMANLKMQADASSDSRFTDRVFYTETLYLNQRYAEAAKLFQDLVNLFPKHPLAPILLLRLGDTYLKRSQVRAASELYKYVLERYSESHLAQAVGKLRLAHIYFITDDLRATRLNEKLLQEAFESGRKAQQPIVSALALAKLAAHYMAFKIYPKAQEVLIQYRALFQEKEVNQKWVHASFIRMAELQITDYYNREDYLAALATYIAYDPEELKDFNDTKVLLKIADAATRLSLYEKALEILNRVVYLEKTSEGRQEALLRLVEILIVEGDVKRASERLRRFNFAYPVTPLKYLYEMSWGDLYLSLKNSEQAVDHYEKALGSAQGKPAALFKIRHVYVRLAENYDRLRLSLKAVEAYEKFASYIGDASASPLSEGNDRLTSKDFFLLKISRYRIADLYFDMKDYVRALEAYRVVAEKVKEEPFLSHAKYRLGECYLALRDRAAALKAFATLRSDDATNLWAKAAESYIKSVQLEVKYGIRIFN